MTAAENMPPKGVDAGELWRRLTARPRPVSDPYDFPEDVDGKPIGRYKLRILSEDELHFCRREADVTARQMMGASAPKNGETSFGYEDIYRNELQVQLVHIATRDCDQPHTMPAFISAKEARKRLTTDQFAIIMRQYNLWRVETGPMLSELTSAECDAWVKVLKEGGRRNPLARLTSEALSDLVMHLIASQSPSDATGSPGTQPESSSPTADAAGPWNE